MKYKRYNMKDYVRQWFMCERKTAYKSKYCAEDVLRKKRKQGMIITGEMHAYKCPSCSCWHLGHRRNRS